MNKCVAIDDDPLFLRLLETYFKEINDFELAGCFSNPVKGALGIVQLKPDILLLDYEMPYIDGFEMLSMIKDKPKVVVISGHLKDPEIKKIPADRFVSKASLKTTEQLREILLEVLTDVA